MLFNAFWRCELDDTGEFPILVLICFHLAGDYIELSVSFRLMSCVQASNVPLFKTLFLRDSFAKISTRFLKCNISTLVQVDNCIIAVLRKDDLRINWGKDGFYTVGPLICFDDFVIITLLSSLKLILFVCLRLCFSIWAFVYNLLLLQALTLSLFFGFNFLVLFQFDFHHLI